MSRKWCGMCLLPWPVVWIVQKSYFCRSQLPIIHPETIRSTQMLLDSIQALASANTLWTFQGAILSMLEPFCGGHLQQKPVFFAPVGIFWYLSKRSPAVYVVLLKAQHCEKSLVTDGRLYEFWLNHFWEHQGFPNQEAFLASDSKGR